MLDKIFRPDPVETKWYDRWESNGAFACDPASPAKPYTIMMPPPNVTGSLHMGHALTFTIQDILIRYHRMKGRDALWQPGTDHAGIATQMVVERNLESRGLSRRAMGREAFLAHAWEWREQSGGTITRQLRRLGASADWARERFTMDESLSRAVRKVFVDLYERGLIYKDQRLVNWDPKLQTAISDLEVEQREVRGHLWHFRYPLEGPDGAPTDEYIVVATTRPETMLGDTGVAVHPDDNRYKELVGKHAMLPIVGRKLKIVADKYADPEQGTGAVKMTPAHDFNDFEVGRRHGLEVINVLDDRGRLNENAPESYRGLDRFEARKKIVAEMERLGRLDKIEDYVHTVPYGDRGGQPIEPWLTEQWYCDAAALAKPAIEAVETGKTKFVPKNWENTYFEWMRNIQPWCVSRQLWWGHRIPAWYGPDGEPFVAIEEAEAVQAARAHYGKDVELIRDPDVLDTWFSSALWPFSTLMWPQETDELKRYYPGDVLVTGFDIIFFWVARMMMAGIAFMDEIPFQTVYIHALVRDEFGHKMSKTRGNVIDPLEAIERYGADALRFTLAAMAAQGRDIKLAVNRVEGYRNFATKLWNAARFCQLNGCAPVPDLATSEFDPAKVENRVNRWIISTATRMVRDVTAALDEYRFNDAAGAIYRFAWRDFCDWHLEFSKPILTGDDEAAQAETRAVAAWTLDRILHVLHPFMPFISEELWEALGFTAASGAKVGLIGRDWPVADSMLIDEAATGELEWIIDLIGQVRAVRAELNVPPAAKIPMLVQADESCQRRLDSHADQVKTLARLDRIDRLNGLAPCGAVQIVVEGATAMLPIADVIDIDRERNRLVKQVEKADAEVSKIDRKLSNEQFLSKAPPEVVQDQRERRQAATQSRDRLTGALQRLSGL